MDIVVEQRTPATIVRISGSVDGLTADTLMATLQQQIDAGNTRLIGDLSGVSYTSSAGLRGGHLAVIQLPVVLAHPFKESSPGS